MFKVLEIFRSIQGEGPYCGVAQVFLRLFECNMHCEWCDTPASIGDTSRHYREVSEEDLLIKVMGLYSGCHSLSITGGEPLMQAEGLMTLLPRFKTAGVKIYLETNGTLPEELAKVIEWVDIVAMDIKLPSSTKQRSFWPEHEAFLKIAKTKEMFLKMVISNDTLDAEMLQASEMIKRIDARLPLILQPNYFNMKPGDGCIAKCVQFQKECAQTLNDVRIIPQVHKFMKLR